MIFISLLKPQSSAVSRWTAAGFGSWVFEQATVTPLFTSLLRLFKLSRDLNRQPFLSVLHVCPQTITYFSFVWELFMCSLNIFGDECTCASVCMHKCGWVYL